MYKFHQDYIRNKNGNKSRLIFTDTDSLVFEIKTEDVYGNFSKDKKNIQLSQNTKMIQTNQLLVR